jgi:hypothetical protein
MGFQPLAPRRSSRKFFVLRQIVGNLKPRCLATDEDMALGPHLWIVIEDT